MEKETKYKEDIYKKLFDLREGNDKDKEVAFECLGILSNESSKEPFDNRLNIVKKLINEHVNKK